MSSDTSCCVKTLPNDKFKNSSFGGKLEVCKHPVTPFLPLITKDNEYESTDGYVPNPEPRDRAKETRCEYIARVGMRFSKGD